MHNGGGCFVYGEFGVCICVSVWFARDGLRSLDEKKKNKQYTNGERGVEMANVNTCNNMNKLMMNGRNEWDLTEKGR